MMVKDMKEILKMIKKKEKESFIIIMVIDMKEILKIIKDREGQFCIIIMVIEKWVII